MVFENNSVKLQSNAGFYSLNGIPEARMISIVLNLLLIKEVSRPEIYANQGVTEENQNHRRLIQKTL